ncbi:M28 family metallopeptidase [Pseudaeromonas paramecii]|uniref:M20/M25/M40 family metallo-hydrolase n=1 Tax=Pseudaeromonas paramecii TaxID=2138166 RepID=A0ABP8Q7J7_9GAMM
MNKTLLLLSLTLVGLLGCQEDATQTTDPAVEAGSKAFDYLVELSDGSVGIGARATGTEAETRTAEWIQDKLTGWGYSPELQAFSYTRRGTEMSSQNVVVTLPGQSDQVVVLGAHYDSTGVSVGSEGATDNGAGVTSLLAVAEAVAGKTLPYTVRMVFFGAEEVGTKGSEAYVASLSSEQLTQILAMVNLDTPVGGDILYVHSAHSDEGEYGCDDASRYSFDPKVRDRLISLSQQGDMTPFVLHPSFPGYPEGETGSWSDHAAFACQGIPVAYLEATNFGINGEDGYDGYSQTTNAALWDCYDADSKSACDRDSETQWGKIWHTQYDRLDRMEEVFPGRIQSQIADSTRLMLRFVQDPGL